MATRADRVEGGVETLSLGTESGRAALLQCLVARRMLANLHIEAWQRLAAILADAIDRKSQPPHSSPTHPRSKRLLTWRWAGAAENDQLDVAVQLLEAAGTYVLEDIGPVNIWGGA